MRLMDTWWQDIEFGIRSLLRQPGQLLILLLTLVPTVAATTAMSSLVRQVILRPLPAPDPERLFSVEIHDAATGRPDGAESVPFDTYSSWREAAAADVDVAWVVIESSVLTENEIGVYSPGHFVSPNFPSLVGVEPVMGRWFTDADGGEPVLAISHRMWKDDLNADENVIGRTISLDKQPFTVIGVMPENYLEFLEPRIRYWRPIDGYPRGGSVIVRFRSDVTPGHVGQIQTLFDRILQQRSPDLEIRLVPLREQVVGPAAASLWLLMAAVSALFLVAILNATSLTLARLVNRIHELATRISLGATRARLLRQLLVENALLALIVAVGSLPVSALLLDLAWIMLPDTFPRADEVSIDAWSWLTAVLAAITTGVVVALFASARVADPARLMDHIKHDGSRLVGGSIRFRRGLIATQVAIALPLLIAVTLLLRSYLALLDEDIGFATERVVSGHIWRPEGLTDAEFTDALDRVRRGIERLPEVRLVAAGSTIPMGPIPTRVDPTVAYAYPGQIVPTGGDAPRVAIRTVTDDFFRVLEIPLVGGRYFDSREATSEAPTVIVNRALAETIWPAGDGVGRTLVLERRGRRIAHTVIGVVANYRFESPDADIKPEAFLAMSQTVFGGASYVVKIDRDDPGPTMLAMATIASELDNSMPMIEIHPMGDLVAGTIGGQQALLNLTFAFAAFATVLAAVGIYGLTSYLIGTRRREIALRITLGADRLRIRNGVIADAVVPVLFGSVAGLVAALLLGNLLNRFLHGVEPQDWPAYAGALLIVLLVGAVAPMGPARRAANVDPASILHHD